MLLSLITAPDWFLHQSICFADLVSAAAWHRGSARWSTCLKVYVASTASLLFSSFQLASPGKPTWMELIDLSLCISMCTHLFKPAPVRHDHARSSDNVCFVMSLQIVLLGSAGLPQDQ